MGAAAKKEKQVLKEQQEVKSEDVGKVSGQELLVPGASAGVPDALSGMMDEVMSDAGAGTSQAAEDNVVPLVRILQSQSPQVMADKPEYIEGAEPGDIYIASLSRVIRGSEGIAVQPAHFSKYWVEWVPRTQGGGFVGQHADLPEDAYEYEAEDNPGVKKWKRKGSKNDLVETRYHGVMMGGAPFFIPFSSSGHTVSRSWMAQMNAARLPGAAKPAPSWARKYRLTTVLRSNKAGDWYTFRVEDLGWVTSPDEYHLGKMLYTQLEAGEKVMEKPDAPEGGTSEEAPF